MTLATACVKDELHDTTHPDVATVRISPDWSRDPQAAPASLVVWFYSLDDTDRQPICAEFTGCDGGEVELPTGKYNVIVYNNDTDLTHADSQGEFHTHLLTTREGSIQELVAGTPADEVLPRPIGTEHEPVMMSPEAVWGSSMAEVTISEEKNGQLQTLQPSMHRLTFRYTFEIRNVQGLKNVTHLCALITGMAPSLTLHDRKSSGEPCSIPLVAHIADDTTIKGEFYTFGRIGKTRTDEIHLFGLYMWLRNGDSFTYGMDGDELFDITDQLVGDDNDENDDNDEKDENDENDENVNNDIHIEIEGLELPPVPDIPGEVTGDITDWNKTDPDDIEIY